MVCHGLPWRCYPVIIEGMPTGRITKRSVEAVPVPPKKSGKREYLWDDSLKGFGVMVTEAGTRCYLVQYKIGGRAGSTKRYSIGHHGNPWTAEKARDRAADVLEDVRKRADPFEAEKAKLADDHERRKTDVRFAFSTYADTFIKRHAEARGLRSVDDIKAVFRRDLKPWFKSKPLTSIKRTDVRDCLDHIGERSGSAANKAHKWLRKLFAWALDRGDIGTSPMEGMAPPHAEGQRERVLRGLEIRHVWKASEYLTHPWSTLAKLLLLTGQRLREVAGMSWEEIDLAAKTWIIPGARTKNKREHLCPLNDQAVAVLTALAPEKKEERKGLILSTNGKTPISGFSKAKAALDDKVAEQVAKAAVWAGGDPEPFAPWVFHDLRRSLATGCQALGIPIEHTEALLNHISGKRGGLAGIYQLHQYGDEKARAATAWGNHVEAIVNSGRSGSNVLAFSGARE